MAYLGAPGEGKQGMSTDKQAFIIILSTDREHQYPTYVKLLEIEKESSVNTDDKTTFNVLKRQLTVKNQKIDYETDKNKLYFLNKIISNFKSKILDLYHGVGKRMLPLYFSEYEWRFNHRHTKNMLDKIFHYIQNASIVTRKMITRSMDNYASQIFKTACLIKRSLKSFNEMRKTDSLMYT